MVKPQKRRYHLSGSSVVNVPVCKSLFIQPLGISCDRVRNVCRKFLETGNAPSEARGGNRKGTVYLGRKQSVKAFIESIPILESHYSRGKNILRSSANLRSSFFLYC